MFYSILSLFTNRYKNEPLTIKCFQNQEIIAGRFRFVQMQFLLRNSNIFILDRFCLFNVKMGICVDKNYIEINVQWYS